MREKSQKISQIGDYVRVYAIKADSYATIKLIEKISSSVRNNFYIQVMITKLRNTINYFKQRETYLMMNEGRTGYVIQDCDVNNRI